MEHSPLKRKVANLLGSRLRSRGGSLPTFLMRAMHLPRAPLKSTAPIQLSMDHVH